MTVIRLGGIYIPFCIIRSDYVQTHSQKIKFYSDAWAILSALELSIKKKIEAVGIPLKDWNVDIFRGVLTGYNEAFIISSKKRDEILANCKDETEKQRTAEIIRPILRGRDIKRYGYTWSGLWLINTHNGTKDGFERIHIEDYPSVKKHLDNYWLSINRRADKGDTPYNLRNCAYLDLLSQPKIVWGEISDKTKFCIDKEGKYIPEATTFMLSGNKLILLLAFLNCSVSEYMFSTIGTTTGVGTVRWKKFKIEQLYVPCHIDNETAKSIEDQCERIISLTEQQGSAHEEERVLNNLIYRFYALSETEIQYIESHIR